MKFVEKYPEIDYSSLNKNLVYPEMAIRLNIKGKVTVRVLVGADGRAMKSFVERSDSQILEGAALDAVQRSHFVPAVQNGSNTECWISIPIVFRMK